MMGDSSKNTQFDSFLGGSQSVPSGFNVEDFIKHRMEEIVMLTETIKESPFRGQTFQRLPKHMRRRQMSHYIKRLPRRLQRPYLLSLKEGLPVPTKRPSRKYRRRPSNLLKEYNRRQREHVWLETHIWHAKRFHMTEKWGYKLPEKPTNKSFRACYRALSEHCLLNDVSYYNCIELQGSESKLLEGLQQCVSGDCGLTFAAKSYLSGVREGFVTLFHPNSYPFRVIGNVHFMWKPVTKNNEPRKIWIWVHPSTHEETTECFQKLFNLKETEGVLEETKNVVKETPESVVLKVNVKSCSKTAKKRKNQNKKSKKKVEQIKLEPKNVPFSRTPKFLNEDGSITMVLLKNTLNRFQLTGPLSHAIISQAFDLIPISAQQDDNCEIEATEIESKKRKLNDVEIVGEVIKKTKLVDSEKSIDVPVVIVNDDETWWEQYYKDEGLKRNWEEQKNFYTKLSKCFTPNDVPSGMILSLVVGDPRLTIPSKREKAVPKANEFCQLANDTLKPSLSCSPIWCPEIRDEVSMHKLSTWEINTARSKVIVPGSDVKNIIPNEKQTRIPILLIQRPGQGDSEFGKLGLGSGWDIIAPAGFGMPIWLALVFRGARTGGLRETELLQMECNNLNGYLQPESRSGNLEALSKYKQLRTQYFKLPPNCRPNFIKLAVASPFFCHWKVLVKDWITKTKSQCEVIEKQDFYVLRSLRTLRALKEAVRSFLKTSINIDSILENVDLNCIVPVLIECSGRGKLKDFALICLPNEKDFKNFKDNKMEPVEALQSDANQSERKKLKTEHLKLLKSLRRKRKKHRLKLKDDFAKNLPGKLKWRDILQSNSAPSTEFSKEYNAKMDSLWVPELESVNSIIDSCSRKILGFVVKGDFCFSKATGTGIGYVTISGLVELLSICKSAKSKAMVLLRNTNQIQYRFGTLRIIS